jgi:hypothetical protein
MFMNETFMKRRALLDGIATCMRVATDNVSAQIGTTRRRSLRSAAHQSNESKMRRYIRNEREISVLANERQRSSMLRCDGLLA